MNVDEFAEKMSGVMNDALNRLDEPHPDCVSMISFPQTWSNTACGHGGMAGQAFTTAQTVVVHNEKEAVVYLAWKFAYRVDQPGKSFWQAVSNQKMPSVSDAHEIRD